jgi:hypothetical protein
LKPAAESCAVPLIPRSWSLFWSLSYLAVRCVLQLVFLRPRSQDLKELETVVLRRCRCYVDKRGDRS